ncbi:Gfo/Idh/MocA family protein [Marinicrinis sediminis]|uniref:Gfo/Idh/MocA family protein n=1 Tax=Marinicrinis sediminis TaxID=1652465 RepID=A0ABW5RG83_9BACL
MSRKLKIGIIGCGGIANAKHMPSLSKLDTVEMVGFTDHEQARAQKAADEYGSLDAKIYPTYMDLLADEAIEVVHVCTSNASHAEITIAALEAGKHVMCEKPIAKTVAEAKLMVETAKRTGKKLTIGYNNRFRPDSQYLHRLCRKGEFGDIYFAKAHAIRRRGVPTWGQFLDQEVQGGGPLIDIGTHALDLTLWMMNNYKPKVVLGTSYHKLGQRANAANPFGPWDPEKFKVEDSAFGMITMENGATIMLESSWALNMLQEGTAKVTLCGTEAGADMWDGLRVNGERDSELYTTSIELNHEGVNFYNTQQQPPGELEARLWIEAILEDKDPVVTPEQALVVSQILEAIYESSRTGKAIYFDEKE